MSGLAIDISEQLLDSIVNRVVERIREAPERRFLSKRSLAEHLGVSERRIKTLRSRGLPARKVGRDLYFDLEEVEAWLDREGRE